MRKGPDGEHSRGTHPDYGPVRRNRLHEGSSTADGHRRAGRTVDGMCAEPVPAAADQTRPEPGDAGQVPGPRLVVTGRLAPDEVAEVIRIVDAATAADGVGPLSEHVRLHLRYGGDAPVRNLLLYADGRLAGYAH